MKHKYKISETAKLEKERRQEMRATRRKSPPLIGVASFSNKELNKQRRKKRKADAAKALLPG